MHIEKNLFENIFNTVMDVKGKTKDNIKARLDIALLCNLQNIEMVWVTGHKTKSKLRVREKRTTTSLQMA